MIYDNYLNVAKRLISFKSISTDKKYVGEINKTVAWLKDFLLGYNFTVEVVEGYGNPILVASYNISNDAETYLIYGHYDVQPATKENGWSSDPFVLTEREGRLYARGIVDNKGQFLIHLVSVIDLIEKGRLAKNVIFVIEGDEETGGGGISRLFGDRPNLFQADQYLISDGEMPYKPVVTASFRGTVNIEIEVETAETNLHSGLYGGAVPSATVEAAKFISAMYDEQYNVQVPEFYEYDATPTDEEVALCKEMDKEKDKAGTFEHTGVRKFTTEKFEGSFCAQVGFTTMVVPSGIVSGYVGEGYANIVPARATIKINARIATDQQVDNLIKGLERFIEEYKTPYAEMKIIDIDSSSPPVKIDISSDAHQKAIKLLEDVYKEKVLVDFCGATLPIVADIKNTFGTDPILVSLGNDDCNMHSADENFDIDLIKKGLEFSTKFFS